MTEHATGPWRAIPCYEGGEVLVGWGIRAKDQSPVVWVENGGAIDEYHARLIAAAPELFDFARDYISAYQNGFDGDDHLMLLAKSLVAKVTGETHG